MKNANNFVEIFSPQLLGSVEKADVAIRVAKINNLLIFEFWRTEWRRVFVLWGFSAGVAGLLWKWGRRRSPQKIAAIRGAAFVLK